MNKRSRQRGKKITKPIALATVDPANGTIKAPTDDEIYDALYAARDKIAEKYKDLVHKAIQGDPEALGEITAEVGLFFAPGDEIRYARNLEMAMYVRVLDPVIIETGEVTTRLVIKGAESADNVGLYLSERTLDDVMKEELEAAGWVRLKPKGSKEIFEHKIPLDNGHYKKHYLTWESKNMEHSIDNMPTYHWKLTEDVPNKSTKVLWRASSAVNFKAGGKGKTFVKGKEVGNPKFIPSKGKK